MASMPSAASMAAAAPRVWPIWDLLAEIGILPRPGPKTARSDATSAASPLGVEVPWALIASMSAGARPASSMASRMARTMVAPLGIVKWWASEVQPIPATSARGLSPCAATAASAARTRMPPPSAMTKPLRSTLNGRDACVGSANARSPSVTLMVAHMFEKPWMISGIRQVSTPPASTKSQSPSRIMRAPMPMAWLPEAQAPWGEKIGPVKPSSMPALPAGTFAQRLGSRYGLTLVGPSRARFSTAMRSASLPLRAEPTRHAVRGAVCPSMTRPACARARWQSAMVRKTKPAFQLRGILAA